MGGDGQYLYSPIFKTSGKNKSKFYCQINIVKRSARQSHGRIALVLHICKAKVKIVTFDLFCKQLDGFYARFHEVGLRLDGDHSESMQGADFDLKLIRKAVD